MIKKLAGAVREYKLPSILTPLFVAFEVVVECIIPFVTAQLIDKIRGGVDVAVIAKYGGILVVLALVSLTCGALAGHFCATASSGFGKNLRRDLFSRVQGFSFANIDKFSTSSLVTRLTTDVNNLQNAYMMVIRGAIRSPFMVIFSLVMAFKMSPRMSTIFVAVIPVLVFGLALITKKAMPIFRRVFKKYDTLNNSVQENVKGMRVVKSYVREAYEEKKFDTASVDVRNDFVRAEKLLAFNAPLMQVCSKTITICVSYFGARLIIGTNEGAMQVGELSGLITYGMQILMSLMMLSMLFVTLTMAIESGRRVCEVLDEESTLKNPENPVDIVADGSIDFRDVTFKYSEKAERYALEGINLHIESGETVGIIGGTGSSKTTLIQLISRLYDVTDGAVYVGGVDVRKYDLETLRNQVSVVLQKNVLFSGTIKENLRWGDKNATDEELIEAAKSACAHEFIESFPDGYDTYIEQGGTNVSGGQRQRLCIARALLKKPKILILDDSTSAVDTKTDALIRKAFRENIPGTTKLIIAQRISSVQDADQIIVLDGGRVDAVGTHEQLLADNEIYKEVYYSQNKAGDEDGRS
ncbi:MAG: ABC transporter ATP-binding protein [Clostridia bacterium]|nr:ABC transporter ATP-binding protein [Clostridia bacterium]